MAAEEVHDLRALLLPSETDYLIRNNGEQVKDPNCEENVIGLYFTGRWCPLCRNFLPKLVEAYDEIWKKGCGFEVVFVSCDRDQEAFDLFFAQIPWFAIPFGDLKKDSLIRSFGVQGVPTLLLIGLGGKIITKDGRGLIASHGADAFPFTEERLKEIEAEKRRSKKSYPERLAHVLHKAHELVLTDRGSYFCNSCHEEGKESSYYCEHCDF